jgi:hypothetical protein
VAAAEEADKEAAWQGERAVVVVVVVVEVAGLTRWHGYGLARVHYALGWHEVSLIGWHEVGARAVHR